jgi:hypothetical protein
MSKSSNRRKTIAIALAVLGVAGLSLASASQLSLNGGGTVQSGALAVNTDCQPEASKITLAFDAPTVTSATVAGVTTSGYASANVTLTGIDAACSTHHYKVALLDSTGALVATTGGEATGTTTPTSLSIPIPAGQDNNIKTVALTIYS